MAKIAATFVRPQNITGTSFSTNYYTVPSGELAIVRYVSLQNNHGSAMQVGIILGSSTPAWFNQQIAAGFTQLYPYVVLVAGDVIQADAATANDCVLCVAGERVVLG